VGCSFFGLGGRVLLAVSRSVSCLVVPVIAGGLFGWGFWRGCPVRFYCVAVGMGFCFGLVGPQNGKPFFMAGSGWFLSDIFGLSGLGFPRCAALRCGGIFRFGPSVILCPTSQSKGLPAVPAGKVSFFITGKRLCFVSSRGQPLTVTLGGRGTEMDVEKWVNVITAILSLLAIVIIKWSHYENLKNILYSNFFTALFF
jgi:hypothetical protein